MQGKSNFCRFLENGNPMNESFREIYIPKIPSYNIMDLAEAISPKSKKKFIGIRPGEKLHEEMISINDSANTFDFKKYYKIINDPNHKIYTQKKKLKKVADNFSYNSGTNKFFLSINELRKLIKENIN